MHRFGKQLQISKSVRSCNKHELSKWFDVISQELDYETPQHLLSKFFLDHKSHFSDESIDSLFGICKRKHNNNNDNMYMNNVNRNKQGSASRHTRRTRLLLSVPKDVFHHIT